MSEAFEKVRAALVGCGGYSEGWGQPALERTGLYEVVACYDPSREAAERAAGRFGARVCGSLEEALGTAGVEAALLMTPNPVHREQAEAAFGAGKHVFVEKPMANTTAECRAMIGAAEGAGRVLMVGHMTRRYPAFRLLAEALKSGRMGRPVGGEAHFSHEGGKQLPREAWRADPAKCPGLPLNVIGCHLVDVLNMLLGRPHKAAAFHRRATVPTNDDCTVTILAYDDPVTATVVSYYSVPQVHVVRLACTDLVGEVTGGGGRFVLRTTKKVVEEKEFTRPHGAAEEEFREFARAVRLGAAVETDGQCGLATVAVTEASVISAREGRFVDVDELARGG